MVGEKRRVELDYFGSGVVVRLKDRGERCEQTKEEERRKKEEEREVLLLT